MTDYQELDEILSPQIMNEDECSECRVNFTEAKAKLEALLRRVEVERVKRIQRGASVLDKDGIMAFLELELKAKGDV